MQMETTAVPRDIKRAIAYIDANLDVAMSLPDIVGVSGVAGRTLLN
jgi:hypothetical protein